jgi:hypothetical protein
MITREKAVEIFDSMKAFRDLHLSMRSTAMELFTHPNATANDVMRVQQSLAKSYAQYRDVYKKFRQATEAKLGRDYKRNWDTLKL